MTFATLATKLLGLSEVIHAWLELLTGLEDKRRRRLGRYAGKIATTLGRAAAALERINDSGSGDVRAARQVTRELGRLSGYIEDMLVLLEDHLDGRKLAGVKRRLETLSRCNLADIRLGPANRNRRIEQFLEAEGYFRALADRLCI